MMEQDTALGLALTADEKVKGDRVSESHSQAWWILIMDVMTAFLRFNLAVRFYI